MNRTIKLGYVSKYNTNQKLRTGFRYSDKCWQQPLKRNGRIEMNGKDENNMQEETHQLKGNKYMNRQNAIWDDDEPDIEPDNATGSKRSKHKWVKDSDDKQTGDRAQWALNMRFVGQGQSSFTIKQSTTIRVELHCMPSAGTRALAAYLQLALNAGTEKGKAI